MVFQDGLQYDAPVVFDNLIAKKEVPPMVGVFVMHGRVKALSEGALDRMNRSFEYDSITTTTRGSSSRSCFPTWPSQHKLRLSADGNDRAIAGTAAAPAVAFIAAWRRPARSAAVQRHRDFVGIPRRRHDPLMIRKSDQADPGVLQDAANETSTTPTAAGGSPTRTCSRPLPVCGRAAPREEPRVVRR